MSKQHASFHQLCTILYQLCETKRSGTLFITTTEHRSAHFTVVAGEIVFCSFGAKRGLQCLAPFRASEGGTYAFSPQVFNVHEPKPIAPVEMIFQELGYADGRPGDTPPSGEAARPVAPAAPPAVPQSLAALARAPLPPIPSARTADPAPAPKPLPAGAPIYPADRLGQILCDELAYYMGPAAPLVCENYYGEIMTVTDEASLLELLSSLAREINPGQQHEFLQNIEARLKSEHIL